MTECPYFDTTHSMADLQYICKVNQEERIIKIEEIDNHFCLTDEHANCEHHPGAKRK